ncbi:DUF362 domain-containing protein [Candidatus Saganbacteria bacterium]|nr:DUF362 domain-containing protein [Candidatus Saganbacteria bacterium]
MNNPVFFSPNLNGIVQLFDAAGFEQIINKDDFVALKVHFGEKGNRAHLKPLRVAAVVEKVKALGGRPFWTDSNTLYRGTRSDSLNHLKTADEHGYNLQNTGAPALIADGLEGKSYAEIEVNFKHFKKISVGSLLMEADAVISLAHFKGHEVAGFGGAIKNVAMGLASRAGKQQMHADLRPIVDKKACTACGRCARWCPQNTIHFLSDGKAEIDLTRCIGCGQCVVTCRVGAISISWAGEPDSVQEKMAEYAAGIANHFKNKIAYINFITDVSENCDCYGHNSDPIVPDIGILASFDPVALDQACADMINNIPGRIKGADKFRALWPNVDWQIQLKHAEKIGLGGREYELITL